MIIWRNSLYQIMDNNGDYDEMISMAMDYAVY